MSYCLKTDAKGIFLTSSHGDIIDTGKTLKCFTIDGENYLVVSGYIITNRWIKHNSKWCYPGADGKFIKNAFVKDSTGYAYLDEDGYFNSELNAWKLIDNKYYRIESGYQVRNAWRKDSTQKYCYLTADGSIFEITGSGWVQIEKEIYYLENNYYRVENSERPDLTGKSCFLDASGKLIRNMLLEVADGIAYLNDKGQIDTGYTGWLFLNNNWYYLTNGYLTINNKVVIEDPKTHKYYRYYFNDSGILQTNALISDDELSTVNKAYVNQDGYFDSSFSGAVTVNGYSYYIRDGFLISKTWKVDDSGREYYINTYGFVTPEVRVSGCGVLDEQGYCTNRTHKHTK